MKRYFAVFILSLGLIVLVSCRDENAPIAEVGDRIFSYRDIDFRLEEQKWENPGTELERPVVLQQLLRTALGAAILQKYGHPVTLEVLRNAHEAMKKRSLMPERLVQAEKLFESKEDFLRLYVLPAYVNNFLYYEFFLKRPEFHQEAFQELDRLRARKPVDLKKWAKESSLLRFSRARITPSEITLLEKSPKANAPSNVQIPSKIQQALDRPGAKTGEAKALQKVLAPLSPGQLTQVLEWPDHFSLIKIVEKKADAVTVEILSRPKANFETWFHKEASTLHWKCFKPELCQGTP